MARKKIKFCLSWPNKTLEISDRLRNIAVLLTGRTITSHSNFILSLSPLVYRMWRQFLLDDPNTKKCQASQSVLPRPWLTETCSLGLPCTSLILDIHVMIKTRYQLTSITWPYRGLKFTSHWGHVFFWSWPLTKCWFSIGSRVHVSLTC